jgi:hypothetical protein
MRVPAAFSPNLEKITTRADRANLVVHAANGGR